MVPDSKAGRTKIARNRNASANSARAKNKVVAGNRVAAISKEATNRADDKSDFLGVFGRRGLTPAVLFVVCRRLQFKSYLQPPRSQRTILFL